ncbi:hypothetical protein JJB11_21325 [Ramlibacter ginsenosidimutans]|uniref:Uncharacterized protein n=1 Tax=Ramlibacter ginsenosidimutans TaxID=502333 RepID=A0A934TWQ2_9BURK|nr:hypothetical protein [Ramlibacter ginsenosidimutans]MBK6008651.1 hypothetical protein [Ramlibacter ginsenosidimutans]
MLQLSGSKMDWLQFWSSLAGSLAWPVAAVAIALLFRSKIAALLGKLRKLEGPAGIKADFSEEVIEAAKEAKLVAVRVEGMGNVAKFGTPALSEPAQVDPPIETHYDSPRWRIMDAYRSVEDAMQKIIHIGKLPKHKGPEGPGFYAYTLRMAGVIDNPTRMLIDKLRDLRDKAVASEEEPDRKDADTFYVAARSVLRTLQMKLHELLLEKEGHFAPR